MEEKLKKDMDKIVGDFDGFIKKIENLAKEITKTEESEKNYDNTISNLNPDRILEDKEFKEKLEAKKEETLKNRKEAIIELKTLLGQDEIDMDEKAKLSIEERGKLDDGNIRGIKDKAAKDLTALREEISKEIRKTEIDLAKKNVEFMEKLSNSVIDEMHEIEAKKAKLVDLIGKCQAKIDKLQELDITKNDVLQQMSKAMKEKLRDTRVVRDLSQPASAQPAPGQPASAQSAPAQSAPGQPAPAQSAPAQPAPAQSAPAQSAPVQPAPAQPAPAQPAPEEKEYASYSEGEENNEYTEPEMIYSEGESYEEETTENLGDEEIVNAFQSEFVEFRREVIAAGSKFSKEQAKRFGEICDRFAEFKEEMVGKISNREVLTIEDKEAIAQQREWLKSAKEELEEIIKGNVENESENEEEIEETNKAKKILLKVANGVKKFFGGIGNRIKAMIDARKVKKLKAGKEVSDENSHNSSNKASFKEKFKAKPVNKITETELQAEIAQRAEELKKAGYEEAEAEEKAKNQINSKYGRTASDEGKDAR